MAAPVILYTDIVSGPNSGGENNNGAYLSIFGKNFGSDLNAITVTINNTTVAAKLALKTAYGRSDIQWLAVQVGAVSTGAIKVSVSGIDSNTDKTFTVTAGDIYFVSHSGNDGTGVANDITQPYRTPNGVMALSAFGPGDMIVVRGDSTYDLAAGGGATENIVFGSWWRINKDGSTNAPLTLMGKPDETVTLLATSHVELCGTTSSSSTTWHVVSNFKYVIQNNDSGNISHIGPQRDDDPNCNGIRFSTFVRLVNWNIDGQGTYGMGSGFGDNMFELGYSNNVKVLGMCVHDTGTNQTNEASHIYYSTATQHDNEWGWNCAYNIPRSRAIFQIHTDNLTGQTCWGVKRITDIQIHDNLIHDVAGQCILLDGGTGDIYVWNNILYNAPTPSANQYEDTLALRGSGGKLNAFVFNNTIYVNANYTSVGWILHFGSVDDGTCPEAVVLRNNIFVVTESQDLYFHAQANCTGLSYVVSDHNIWYGSSAGLPSFAGTGDTVTDPLMINPAGADFHLQAGSPAIGAGTNVVSPTVPWDFDGVSRGATYDIGAYEYAAAEAINIGAWKSL